MTNTTAPRPSDRDARLARYQELFDLIPVPDGTNKSDIKTLRRKIVIEVTQVKTGTLNQWHMRKPHRAPSWAVLRLIENHIKPSVTA